MFSSKSRAAPVLNPQANLPFYTCGQPSLQPLGYYALPVGAGFSPLVMPTQVLLPCYVAPGKVEYHPFVLQPVNWGQQPNLISEAVPAPAPSPSPSPAPGRTPEIMPETERKQARKYAKKFIKQKRREQSTGFIQECLAEKVLKSESYQQHIKNSRIDRGGRFASELGSPVYAQWRTKDYSQYAVIEKINAFLRKNYCGTTPSKYYCNGITLLWLLMMSWRLEPLFYKMVKEIVDCPFDELHTIYKTILQFLDWIDLGQNPGKYSNSRCTQDDIHKIIGNIKDMTAIKKDFNLEQATDLFGKLATKNTILALGGYSGPRGTMGHTIGAFYRDGKYYLFDSDYRSGKPKIFSSAKQAAVEAEYSLFSAGGRKLPPRTNRWEFFVSHRPARWVSTNDSKLNEKAGAGLSTWGKSKK